MLSEGGACFGVALKTKNPELRSQAISSGVGAILAGVSEPAIYGSQSASKKANVWCYGWWCKLAVVLLDFLE